FTQLGDDKGAFTAAVQVTAPAGVTDIVLAKIDGDDDLDILVTDAAGGKLVFLAGGDKATFGAAQPSAAGPGPGMIAVGKSNEDGHADVAVVNPTDGKASVLIQNAAPELADPVMPPEATVEEAGDASTQNIGAIEGEIKVTDSDKG